MIIKHPDISSKTLSQFSQSDLTSFWFFYLDNPYPPQKFPDELKEMKKYSDKVFLSAQKAFEHIRESTKK